MSEELKLCPWCGKKPSFISPDKMYGYYKCTNLVCPSVTPDDENIKQDATRIWNRCQPAPTSAVDWDELSRMIFRITPTKTHEVIEQLKANQSRWLKEHNDGS